MIPKISVVIIAKNAAKHLAECLKHLSWANEIIFVDSGSTDKTIDIAKKHKAKIFSQRWLGYARQKNYAISKAKNNWVLSLDADEILDKDMMREFQETDIFNYDGYYINRKNYFLGKWIQHCGWYPDWQLRFFKKDMMCFEEKAVHETVKEKGKIGRLKGNILHYSYSNTKEYFDKIEKYTKLDAEILYQKNRKWSLFYQFGKPFKEFVQMYFTKKGFLDGWIGLKLCVYSAYYRFVTARKLRMLEKASLNKDNSENRN